MSIKRFNETRLQLQTGYFFSPGFFLEYWQSQILPNFSPDEVTFGNKLKQHREVWFGAHLAALKTHLSGKQFFVGLPDTDPPDVLIGDFHKVRTASGKIGQNLKWFPVENTRCDMAVGENLLDQILKKDRSAYRNTVLAVYLQGAEVMPNTKELSERLQSRSDFNPTEVVIMVELRDGANEGIPNHSFGFVQVYPTYSTVVISRDNRNAFFTQPSVMIVTGRGVKDRAEHLGTIRLMPPD